MDDQTRVEHELSLEELRRRLDPRLAQSLRHRGELAEGLLEHLRARDQRVILFDPARISGIEEPQG